MIKKNLSRIEKQIEEALAKRTEEKITGNKVTLVAVSKTHPAIEVQEAISAGMAVFGENKVQEAAEKILLVNSGQWHLIGHLQTNKVKKAVSLFEIIYSVDSIPLLLAVDREAAKQRKRQNILLQVNVAGEESKFGFSENDFFDVVAQTAELSNICLRGLMVIAPETEDAEIVRPVFKKGYEMFCALKASYAGNNAVDILSMGMSGDFSVAIQEGANNIRLGTLIFGKRNYAGV